MKFYAALGNHDNPDQRLNKLFNMQNRYYTYTKGDIRFFVLDSQYMDPEQLKWLEKELQNSGSAWKICYSSGAAHGSSTDLRALLEPLFVKYGVNVLFAGKGQGSKGEGDLLFHQWFGWPAQTWRHPPYGDDGQGFDQDLSFMLVEVSGDELNFQVISRTGSSVDAGMIQRTVSKIISSAPTLGGS